MTDSIERVQPELALPEKRRLVAMLALVLLTLVAYLPALEAGFIWDDDFYVTQNPTLRTTAGLGRIWFEPTSIPQYYPLVHTTFWLEYRLFGTNAKGYHLVNVLLHALGAILLWRVLLQLEVKAAGLAAALFALHPVQVESVAWITERKNTLSTCFYFLAAGLFLPLLVGTRPADPATGEASPKLTWRRYVGGVLAWMAALLSKTVTCSLPAALLLVTWWKNGELKRRDVWLTAPLFVLGLAAGLTTLHLERHHVGAQGSEWDFSLVERGLIAGRALWFYVGKLLWPAELTFIYPRFAVDARAGWQWLFPLGVLALVYALFRLRARWGRGPLVAVLFFAGTLFPALGFFNVFPMRYSFVADHFQYLASSGLIALAAAGVGLSLARGGRLWQGLLAAACAVGLATFLVLTARQTLIYRDAETLWRDTLAKNPQSWMARDNLAGLLLRQAQAATERGDFAAARELQAESTAQLEQSLALHQDAFTLAYLGQARLLEARFAEAVPLLQAAVAEDPERLNTRLNLAAALRQLGRDAEARGEIEQVLRQKPQFVPALQNLANLLLTTPDPQLRDPARALELAEQACALTGNESALPFVVLADAQLALGRSEEARSNLARALTLARASPQLQALAVELERKLTDLPP